MPDIDPILDGPVAAGVRGDRRRARGRSSSSATRSVSGIVPMHAGARAYRDLVGIAHQRLAAMADEAYLLVAGLPVTLKGGTRPMTADVDASASTDAAGRDRRARPAGRRRDGGRRDRPRRG